MFEKGDVYDLPDTSPGKLGYACEAASFQEAMKTKIDVIAADVGSIDPGPYYLGAGKSYAEGLARVIRSKNAKVNKITYDLSADV